MGRSKSPLTAARRAERERRQRIPDRVATWTVVGVIILGAAFFLVWYFVTGGMDADHHGAGRSTPSPNESAIHR